MPSPDARFDSWYEVWTTFGGVLENTYDVQDYAAVARKVKELISEFKANCNDDDDLDIYILHHTCGQSVECDCAQYATNHKPCWQSKTCA